MFLTSSIFASVMSIFTIYKIVKLQYTKRRAVRIKKSSALLNKSIGLPINHLPPGSRIEDWLIDRPTFLENLPKEHKDVTSSSFIKKK